MPRRPQTQKPSQDSDESQGAQADEQTQDGQNDDPDTSTMTDEQLAAAQRSGLDEEQPDGDSIDEQEQQEQDAAPAPTGDTLIRTYHATDDSDNYADVLERDGTVIAVAHLDGAVITFTPREARNPGSAARQVAAIVARRIARIEVEITSD